ncbi:hypothetical protein, conserved [Eimeria necatrix]|uniref:Transmembrane protein n=1 Tax=Eimeria necatrix TaxID=51315 RepID=U6MLP6_9EIME|nr:hypothetical protein, conserved [Eimeria necatrix]CDJ64003.1 hypothetical protein, conserved [Eimeria necatrix]
MRHDLLHLYSLPLLLSIIAECLCASSAEALPLLQAERRHPLEGEWRELLAPSTSHKPDPVRNTKISVGSKNSGQLWVGPGRRLRRQRPSSASFPAALASAVSLAVTLAFLALCLAEQIKKRGSGVEPRSLSDGGGDKELSDILEGCVSLEEELRLYRGASGPQEPSRRWSGQPVPSYEPAGLTDGRDYQSLHRLGEESHSHSNGLAAVESNASDRGDGRWWFNLHYGKQREDAPSWYSDERPAWSFVGQYGVDETGGEGMFRGIMVSPHAMPQQQAPPNAISYTLPDDETSIPLLDALAPDAWLMYIPQLLFEDGTEVNPETEATNQFPVDGSGPSASQQFPRASHSMQPSAASPAPLQSDDKSVGCILHAEGSMKDSFRGLTPHVTLKRPYELVTEDPMLQDTTVRAAASGVATAEQTSSSVVVVPSLKRLRGTDCGSDSGSAVLTDTFAARGEDTEEALPVERAAASTQHCSEGFTAGTGELPKSRTETRDMLMHPYWRLPVVDPKNVRRSFRREFALSMYVRETTPMKLYTAMRGLFLKPALDAEDVEELISTAERLASYARIKLAWKHMRPAPFHLARKIASIIVALDYLVCTVELLGEKMDAKNWWDLFVQQLYLEIPVSSGKFVGNASVALKKMVRRLSAALIIYKAGKRPPRDEVIELKRLIFTKLNTHCQFQNPLWDLWVEDDLKFMSSAS